MSRSTIVEFPTKTNIANGLTEEPEYWATQIANWHLYILLEQQDASSSFRAGRGPNT